MVPSDRLSRKFVDKWTAANVIPHLGGGGRSIAAELVYQAQQVPDGYSIVDVGPWIGSTTAFLAIGASPFVEIHAYDRWTVDAEMKYNAWRQQKVGLKVGESTFPLWAINVAPFGENIHPHKGDVHDPVNDEIPDGRIGLLVDDCSSGIPKLDRLFARFYPGMADMATVIMLDYYFHETKTHPKFEGTVQWFKIHRDRFAGPRRIPGSTAAVFTFTRGKR